MTELKVTPLCDTHIALGARMVEFGGWNMPVQYTGIIGEHQATRQQAGLFDICHMGEFYISGDGAFDLLQQVTTNDVSRLAAGQCHYSTMCNEQGGVIDDLILYRLEETKYMMVVNAGTRENDLHHLSTQNRFGAVLEDISDRTAKLDLQGPNSRDIVRRVCDAKGVHGLHYFTFQLCRVGGVEALVSRTGYTGELGYEFYFDAEKAVQIWSLLLETGKEFGLVPVGLGARDTLRLEMGYSLYGHELDPDHSPLEAGLGWVVKLDKGEFLGSRALAVQKEAGLKRKLIAFELTQKGVPRAGYPIIADDKKIGKVTSGSVGPSVEKGIGLGYVETAAAEREIEIEVRNRRLKARIVPLPFYTNGTVKA